MTSDTTKTADGSLGRSWFDFARYHLANRWVLLVLGGLVVVIGVALNWGWLVAAGIAPVLVAAAPCAIMCALGLCGMKMMGAPSESKASRGAERYSGRWRRPALPKIDRPTSVGSSCCDDVAHASPQSKRAENSTTR